MRIEAIDRIRANDDDGTPIRAEPGDHLTVGENFGNMACSLGWARDLDGKVETGARTRDRVVVKPGNVVQTAQ